MPPIRPAGRKRLWFQFLLGLAYLALLALLITALTGRSYRIVFPCVVCAALICSGVGLTWLTLWARRQDSRVGQFGVGSLLFLTVFVAGYFALVRWLVDAAKANAEPPFDDWAFVAFAMFCLPLVLLAILLMLRMTDSLVWLGVWLLRRRMVRRFLADRRRRE